MTTVLVWRHNDNNGGGFFVRLMFRFIISGCDVVLLLFQVGEVGELSEIFQWRGEVARGLPDWKDEEKEHLGEELSDTSCCFLLGSLMYAVLILEKLPWESWRSMLSIIRSIFARAAQKSTRKSMSATMPVVVVLQVAFIAAAAQIAVMVFDGFEIMSLLTRVVALPS